MPILVHMQNTKVLYLVPYKKLSAERNAFSRIVSCSCYVFAVANIPILGHGDMFEMALFEMVLQTEFKAGRIDISCQEMFA